MVAVPDEDAEFADLGKLPRSKLRQVWLNEFGENPPACFGRELLALGIAYDRQERRYGGFRKSTIRELDRLFARVLSGESAKGRAAPFGRPGTVLVRQWKSSTHRVTVVENGFVWNGKTHSSLSAIATAITGTKWNGPRFFGLREEPDGL
jgi:hypothetical protein